MGTIQLANVLASGYRGSIYPVHPLEDRVADMQTYRSARDIPHTVDTAILTLPTKVVPEALEDLVPAGIKGRS